MSSSDNDNGQGHSAPPTSSFEERLGAEPRQTAAALHAAVEAGVDVHPDRLAAAKSAEALEQRIGETLTQVAVPADLVEGLVELPAQQKRPQGLPGWLAIAASVVLLVGVSSVLWLGETPQDKAIERYVAEHFEHDGASVLASAANGMDPAQVEAVMASLGARASADLAGRVQYIKFCPTPDSKGAHMVVSTAEGPATVIFMPAVNLDAPMLLRIDGKETRVVSLTSGAAAIIGPGGEAVRELEAMLEEGIQPLSADI